MSERKTVGVSLGGGGIRGAAHIGVLKVLHEAGIPITRLAGSSSGAIIGAMYAATRDPEWMENHFRTFLNSDAFHQLGTDALKKDRDPDSFLDQIARKVQDRLVIMLAMSRNSVIKRERLEKAIQYLLPVKSFEELAIPLDVAATDLVSGETVYYHSGNLIEAVVQSSSIPGFVPPTTANGKILVDGGVSAPNPVLELKRRTDLVIAVDIARRNLAPEPPGNILDIISRTEAVTSMHLNDLMIQAADVVIEPDVLGLHWSEFDQFEPLFQNGIQAAEKSLPIIRQGLHRSFWSRIKFWRSSS
ncbi:MAG: hypothetical protein GXO90_06225 [FCB group bacterium]|nr:hypothetical protein [FCB group bacterium]